MQIAYANGYLQAVGVVLDCCSLVFHPHQSGNLSHCGSVIMGFNLGIESLGMDLVAII
ncbi:hypothetical protein SAMN02745225_01446 [Ferrithrix thermotolerans DSM 19514]|uniref:Uncharacterized protein n=1 Tax=Ferrithrix thermotolerans DSM 19514 TaxID=1121881 RepID=A0A1M4VUX9_9ACTN|nr:hypothetical protein SAMN02745225_01446 [Ferrithrix thermotolerans DSM 19514]